MVKAEIVVVHELSKWESGKWKYGIKVHTRRNLVVLQNFIYANTVYDMQKVVKF